MSVDKVVKALPVMQRSAECCSEMRILAGVGYLELPMHSDIHGQDRIQARGWTSTAVTVE